jgi:O-antigen/teichoic acid export membrane protein
MAVLQFWGFPACKTGDFHFAILGIFSLQETNTFCLTFGLVINLTLNFYMIPLYGIKGAALATLAGYTGSILLTELSHPLTGS